MNDEIKVGDETYISSKRASEITGYARDYIGQLARKGLIDARRIGGLWYISAASLNTYKQEAESFKPEPPQNANRREDPETIVSFDGKEYVSAIKAAKLTGYHQDYVSQLAREDKVPSRQIGSRWYVGREGLISHKKSKDALLAAVQAESVGIRPTQSVQRALSDINYGGAGPYMTYTKDEGDLLPLMPEATYQKSESWNDEVPISGRISSIHSIPIRKLQVENFEDMDANHHRISEYQTRSARRRSRSISGAGISVAVATIVIVVVVGYISFQSKAVYTQAAPTNSGLALVAYIADVLAGVGDFIEHIVAPEIIYNRSI